MGNDVTVEAGQSAVFTVPIRSKWTASSKEDAHSIGLYRSDIDNTHGAAESPQAISIRSTYNAQRLFESDVFADQLR